MPTVQTVAQNIVRKTGATGKKLQKLAYYCEAWSLAWDDQSLFDDPIQAWKNGPCCRSLRNKQSGGDPSTLTLTQEAAIDDVVRMYGDMTEPELIDLTHQELPWVEARRRLKPSDPGTREMSRDTMKRCYREQERAFTELFQEFGLRSRIHRGRIRFVGTRQQAEAEIDRICRLLHDRTLSPLKHTLLIQASGRCEYVEA
jgi:uncharacterized phage-associated protein